MKEKNSIIKKGKKECISDINSSKEISVWFKNEKKVLIHELIEKNLNLDTLIGKETKKAIYKLIRRLKQKKKYRLYNPEEKTIIDQKGRDFIPFNDPDFY